MSIEKRTLKLFVAIENDNIIQVKELLAQGVYLAYKNKNNNTPIQFAAKRLNWQCVKAIAEFKDAGRTDSYCYGDALFFAVQNNELDIAKILLQAHASKNWHDAETDNYCIHVAVINNNPAMLVLLLNYSFDPGIKNKAGQTILTLASSLGHWDCVNFIINSYSVSDESYKQVLSDVVQKYHWPIILNFLQKKGSLDDLHDITLNDKLIEEYRKNVKSLFIDMYDKTISADELPYAIKLVQFYFHMILKYHRDVLIKKRDPLKQKMLQNRLISETLDPDSALSKITAKIEAINSILDNANTILTINLAEDMDDQLKEDLQNLQNCNEKIYHYVVQIQIALQEIKLGVEKIKKTKSTLQTGLLELDFSIQRFYTWMNTIPTTIDIQKILHSYFDLTFLMTSFKSSFSTLYRNSLLDEYHELATNKIADITKIAFLSPTAKVTVAKPDAQSTTLLPHDQQDLSTIDDFDQPCSLDKQTSVIDLSMWDNKPVKSSATQNTREVLYTPFYKH